MSQNQIKPIHKLLDVAPCGACRPWFLKQSYPLRVLDRRLQEAWARATKEGPRILMNLRVDF